VSALTDRLRPHAIILHNDGLRPRDIALRLGTSKSTIVRILQREGLMRILGKRKNVKRIYKRREVTDPMLLDRGKHEPQECPGFPLFCAECMTPPRCMVWHCSKCAAICHCRECVHSSEWHDAFELWQEERNRGKRALGRYDSSALDGLDARR
jgi:hypothetical protein